MLREQSVSVPERFVCVVGFALARPELRVCLLHKTVDKGGLAVVEVAHQRHIPDQVAVVHQVSHVLWVVRRLGQLKRRFVIRAFFLETWI